MIPQHHYEAAVIHHQTGPDTAVPVPARILFITADHVIVAWPRRASDPTIAHPERVPWDQIHSLHRTYEGALALAGQLHLATAKAPNDTSALQS